MINTSKNVTAAVLTVNSTVARTSLGAVAFSVREPDQYLFHVYPYVRGLVMSNAIGRGNPLRSPRPTSARH